jgi:hypothetical protein
MQKLRETGEHPILVAAPLWGVMHSIARAFHGAQHGGYSNRSLVTDH